MTELTPYQQTMFSNLEKVEIGKWYAIKADRPDRESFVEALKLYSDVYHTLTFDSGYKAFKIALNPKSAVWVHEHTGLWDNITYNYDKEEMMKRVFAYHDELAKNLKYKR